MPRGLGVRGWGLDVQSPRPNPHPPYGVRFATPAIMRRIFVALFATVSAVSVAAQQSPSRNASKSKTLTLSGCVQRSDAKPGDYTLTSDDQESGTYRLTGLDVREFVGKRVEVIGVPPKLRIKGGLYPNPNVAAQAGAMDPAKAATEAAAGGPAATTASPLPEFRIQSIKPVAGNCPER